MPTTNQKRPPGLPADPHPAAKKARARKSKINETALVAFGVWYGCERKPSPYRKLLNAATFVNECLNPGTDVLKFLLPEAKIKSARGRKFHAELIAKPAVITAGQWTTVRDIVTRLIEQYDKNYEETTDDDIRKYEQRLREHAKACQNMYAHLAFIMNLKKSTDRKAVHQQVMVRFDNRAVTTEKRLEEEIESYSRDMFRQLSLERYWQECVVDKKTHVTRAYMTLQKKLKEKGYWVEGASMAQLRKRLAQAAKATAPPASKPNRTKTATASQLDKGTAQLPTKPSTADVESDPDRKPAARRSLRTQNHATDTGAPVNGNESIGPKERTSEDSSETVAASSSGNNDSCDDYDDYSSNDEAESVDAAAAEDDPNDPTFRAPIHERTAKLASVRHQARIAAGGIVGRPKEGGTTKSQGRRHRRGGPEDFIDSRDNSGSATTNEGEVSIERTPFDIGWLFKEPTHQHLCLEQPKEGCTGSEESSIFTERTVQGEAITFFTDQNTLAACHDVVVGPLYSYMFNESRDAAHGELTQEEANDLFQLCRQHGIKYDYYPPTGMSSDSNFIKVAHHGSDDWNHVWQGLQFNAPEVIRIIRKLHDQGDKAIKAGSDDKRNSIHFDGGFTCASYNYQDSPEEAPTIASFPVMNNEPKEGNPPEYGWLYEHVADVLDRCQTYTDLRGWENGQRPMNDAFRTSKAGEVLREKCGGTKSRWETFTISITILGTVEEYEKDRSFNNTKYRVGRHKDGPNDKRRGYKWTCVFSCVIVVDGVVYRLVVIAYTRLAIGDAIETELHCMRVIKADLDLWLAERPSLKDANLETNGEVCQHCYHKDNQSFPETGRKHPSFADPNGSYSATLDAIERLSKHRLLPRAFWVELLILILRHNSAMMQRNILLRWLPNAGGAERFEAGRKKGYGPHTLFLIECEASGISVGGGKCPRMQWSAGSRWPDERVGPDEKQRVADDIAKMDQILKDAEQEHWLHEDIIDRVEGLRDIGATKTLSFYSIAVQAGYLTSKHAVRESYFAKMSENNPGGRQLEKLKFPDLQKGLHRLAWLYGLEQYIMENILCKKWRWAGFCWDFVANGQTMFCRTKVSNDEGQERTIFLKKEWNGGTWEEYTPELRGFKDE